MFHVLDFAFNLIDCNNKTFHGEDLTSNPKESYGNSILEFSLTPSTVLTCIVCVYHSALDIDVRYRKNFYSFQRKVSVVIWSQSQNELDHCGML